MGPDLLARYTSSRGPATYDIIRGADGVIYCTCPGWKMHNKNCKHLLDFNGNSGRAAAMIFTGTDTLEAIDEMPKVKTTGDPMEIAIQNAARMMGNNR